MSFVKRVLTLFKDAQKIVKIELEMRPPLQNEPDEVPDTIHATRKQIRRFTTRTITLGKVQDSSNWTHRVERQHHSICHSQPNCEYPTYMYVPQFETNLQWFRLTCYSMGSGLILLRLTLHEIYINLLFNLYRKFVIFMYLLYCVIPGAHANSMPVRQEYRIYVHWMDKYY